LCAVVGGGGPQWSSARYKNTSGARSWVGRKAVEAVKEWKFEPAMKDGQPVAVQTYVQVQFQRHELFDSDPQEHLAKSVAQSNLVAIHKNN
jgi:hypothetical protein